jgi:hypothetical protein
MSRGLALRALAAGFLAWLLYVFAAPTRPGAVIFGVVVAALWLFLNRSNRAEC